MTLLSDEEISNLWLKQPAGGAGIASAFARAIEAAVLAKLREQEPIKWTHSCNVLCLDNVELWIDRCPHCGKPADHPMPSKEHEK